MTRGRGAFSGRRPVTDSKGSKSGPRVVRPPEGPVRDAVRRAARPGFTLIELMIVITILGILVTIAQPSYNRAVLSAKEATLKENLFILRDRIDQFYADNGKYPDALNDLAEKRYIRRVPTDPLTGSAESWKLVFATDDKGQQAGIMDVQSGSEATAMDGTKYSDW